MCSSSRLSRENLANLDVEGMDTDEETAPGTGLPGAGDYRKRKLSVMSINNGEQCILFKTMLSSIFMKTKALLDFNC